MRILSWNILAARRDLRPLFGEVIAAQADVVCFQEVEWWAYEQLLRSELASLYPHEGVVRHADRDLPGWLHMRSRVPIDRSWVVVFEHSQTGRGLLCCEVGGVVVATTHMESHPDATALRLGQIDEIDRALKGYDHAVVIGDLNFDDGAESERFLELGWVDSAVACGELSATWDPTQNQLAGLHGFPGEDSPLRIDRSYCRGLRPAGFEVVRSVWSDHWPIISDF